MKKIFRLILLAMIVIQPGRLIAADDATTHAVLHKPDAERPLVQLAILLDTSNSMDGLIEQAKSQLWRIVNEFVGASRGGVRPRLQVALFEYGKPALGIESGYIRMIQPLTDDLDKISEELFALRTSGGQEYCGQVIEAAAGRLDWSASPKDLKVIFIAGNEPFTQGGVDYKIACKAAITKGIAVNTIFCGGYDEGVATQWKDGALRADGSYMNIDQNQKIAHIAAPQDEELARLGSEINDTYIAYGALGGAKLANQAVQDSNAMQMAPSSMAERAATKASPIYNNSAWDLVDLQGMDAKKLADIPAAELPKEMQTMNEGERAAHVKKKAEERAAIQKKIGELSKAREEFIAKEMKKREAAGEETLDAAIIKAVREQAAKKDFQFEK